MFLNQPISPSGPLSVLAIENDIQTWSDLILRIMNLPYGRNENRHDFSLVLKEGKGSCSSKHAFLHSIAMENNWADIELVLAIYKMNSQNTPKVEKVLHEYAIDYLPEAHCYIRINGSRKDYTFPNSSIEKIEGDILLEEYIQAHQVAEYKINFHQSFIRKWILENELSYSFDELWSIREKCIQALYS